MKVIIIIDQFSDNETTRLILNEEREFRRRDIDIVILTLRSEDPKSSLSRSLQYPERDFRYLPVKNVFDMSGWKRLVTYLKEEKPDLVMTHLSAGNSIGRIAAFIAKVPKIISFESGEKASTVDQVLQFLSDKVVATSDAQAMALERYDIKKRKLVVLHNSINPAMYKKGTQQDLRRELGVAPGAFLFLYFGPLTKERGVDVLLRAFVKVKTGILIIMGDGSEYKELVSLSKHLLLTRRVFFFPVPKNMLQMFATADCLVIPSREEGATDIIIGALASGLPVTVTDFPSHRDLVVDGRNGFVVKSQDSEDLALVMQRMISEPGLHETLRANTAVGLEKYSPIAHAEKILELAAETDSVVYHYLRFLRFLGVFGVSTVFQLAISYILTEFLSFRFFESASIGFMIISVGSFAAFKWRVFQDIPKMKIFWQFPSFLLGMAAFTAINGLMIFAVVTFTGLWYLFAQAALLVIFMYPILWLSKLIFENK